MSLSICPRTRATQDALIRQRQQMEVKRKKQERKAVSTAQRDQIESETTRAK